MSLIVPLSRTTSPGLVEVGAHEAHVLAGALSAGIEHAHVPTVLRILEESRPPVKRFRRRFGRCAVEVQGFAQIRARSYFELEHNLRRIVPYEVRNRLPAALTVYNLVTVHGLATARLFHNGLLSEFALSAILSSSSEAVTGAQTISAGAASRKEETETMKNHQPGAATPHFIAGVNLPLIEAEPEVVVAFHKHFADAIRDAETATDETAEIEKLVAKGRALLRSLEH